MYKVVSRTPSLTSTLWDTCLNGQYVSLPSFAAENRDHRHLFSCVEGTDHAGFMWKQGSVFFSTDAFSLAGAKTLLSRFPVIVFAFILFKIVLVQWKDLYTLELLVWVSQMFWYIICQSNKLHCLRSNQSKAVLIVLQGFILSRSENNFVRSPEVALLPH